MPHGTHIIHRRPVLKPELLAVTHEGEYVRLKVGQGENAPTLELHYADALTISQWIRLHAKLAKSECGDRSRHWSAVADLNFIDNWEGSGGRKRKP